MRKHRKNKIMYIGYMDFLEKPYDRVNRNGLWQVLRIYDFDIKL